MENEELNLMFHDIATKIMDGTDGLVDKSIQRDIISNVRDSVLEFAGKSYKTNYVENVRRYKSSGDRGFVSIYVIEPQDIPSYFLLVDRVEHDEQNIKIKSTETFLHVDNDSDNFNEACVYIQDSMEIIQSYLNGGERNIDFGSMPLADIYKHSEIVLDARRYSSAISDIAQHLSIR